MKYKLAELFCVISIILFIVFSISTNTKTEKSAKEISAEIIEQIGISELSERTLNFSTKHLSSNRMCLKALHIIHPMML